MTGKNTLIPLNENNCVFGETHPRTRIPDRDVDMLRDMYEEGAGSLRVLAAAFGISRSHAHRIVRCINRAHYAQKWVSRAK